MNDTTSTGRRRSSARTRNLIIAAVVVLAAGGWYGWHLYSAKSNKDGDYIFAKVEKGDVEDLVTATGALQPRDYVDVGAQVTGQIEKLYVDVGDQVKEGDKLAEIDATQSQARVDSDQASLDSALNALENQNVALAKAQRDYERQQNLLKEDATTAQAAADAATALEQAKHQITTSTLQIAQQKANMRVEVQNLAYTTIKAPISGTVMSLAVKQGQTINASQSAPTVLRIANLGTMTVQSDVSEADVAKLHIGMPVYFTTLSGNRQWRSVLKRVDPTPKTQNSVVLYNALFDIANEGDALKPSMTAQVYFINASAEGVLTVPMAALQQGQQIARELAAKEKKDGKTPAGAPGTPAAAPGAAPAGGPAAAGAATAAAAPGTPAAAATAGTKPADAQATMQGNRRAGADGQGTAGGNGFGGQRPGGGGFAGGGNFGQNMTPEQREEMRKRMQAMRAAGGGGAGGFGGGNFNRQGMGANAGGAEAGAPRRAQRRTGTVMVKKADGTLEARRVVIGVTNRVSGQVLEGLKEGEEVVIGKHEDEAAAAPRPNNNQNQPNQNQNRPNNFQGGGLGGGFPGGGRF